MRKLIVNADDFGLTLGVACGIVKAHQAGIVTSTTILINSPHLEGALAKLKEAPTLDLGLHLNVTWGRPVSDPSHVKSLIGDNGSFIRRTGNFENVDLDEVETEWNAQIAKARSCQLSLTHLDTHHHAHLHPAFLDLMAAIASKEGLAVRSQQTWVRDFLRSNSIRTTDHFIGDFYGEGKTSLDHLQSLLHRIPDGSVEVCCHPAIVDAELRKISSYNEPRSAELQTLTDLSLKSWLNENGFVLSRFDSLPAMSSAPDKSCELK